MFTTIGMQRAGVLGGDTLDESQIRRDERGLARWTKEGISLLTPTSVDPGARPQTHNSNEKPGDNIVEWFNWDDANYAWELANERFKLPRDYSPPPLSSFVLSRAVSGDTAEAVKANALTARRAAGIADSDATSTTTPSPKFIPPAITIAPMLPIPGNAITTNGGLNANRVAGDGSTSAQPARYMIGGELVDANGKAQPLPTNATTATVPRNYMPYVLAAVAVALLVMYARKRKG